MSDTPKVGDEIELRYRGRVHRLRSDGYVQFRNNGPWYGTSKRLEPVASVEILERADDPAKDPVGTVRENTGGFGGVYVKTAVQHGEVPWIHVERGFRTGHPETVGKIVGTVPGTPAAEAAEKPAEPEYEYFLNDDLEYRVKDGLVEFWCINYWKTSGGFPSRAALLGSEYTAKLDGKPSDVD